MLLEQLDRASMRPVSAASRLRYQSVNWSFPSTFHAMLRVYEKAYTWHRWWLEPLGCFSGRIHPAILAEAVSARP